MSAIKLVWVLTEAYMKSEPSRALRAVLSAALSAPFVPLGAHRSSVAPSVQICDWRPV